MRTLLILLLSTLLATSILQADTPSALPGTQLLESATGDARSVAMVAGIDRFSMKLIKEAAKSRHANWKQSLADSAHRESFINTMREKLRTCIGLVDEIVPNPGLQRLSANPENKPLAETDDWTAWYVRWPVFDGVYGSGVLLQPKGKVRACVICLPDADEAPMAALFGAHETPQAAHHGAELASLGCQVVVPLLTDRGHAASVSEPLHLKTNATHREWIYRQAFLLGRNISGYEVASMLSLIEAMEGANIATHPPIGMVGHGEGGWLALYTSAIADRIKSTWVSSCFTARESLWEEPLDRNAFNFVTDFGAAELGAMIHPRKLTVSLLGDGPVIEHLHPAEAGVQDIVAPYKLGGITKEAIVSELTRLHDLRPEAKSEGGIYDFLAALGLDGAEGRHVQAITQDKTNQAPMVADDWQAENVRQLTDFTQKLIPLCEQERGEKFWKKLPLKAEPILEAYGTHLASEREHLWKDVIGQLPDPSLPMNPRSRFISEDEFFTVHEVMLDVWPDVVAWGYLLLPKNMKPGEKRPVVICQHGLDGLPEDVVTEDQKTRGWKFYKAFATNLAREGFITFAPHNFYRGKDAFRVIQRKLNLTGKTLFSVMIGQHQRILEWLKTQPHVDEKRIAFYGLSYGGKAAMRIPAVLPDYCLSICSGDFNEWVRKCVSTELSLNFVFKNEYEMWEPNLGRTFNYAEMAALIAPRPFMVERGHNDGVGIDEWVGYEYAKVHRLYDQLGIGDRTEIEYFDGPHTINGKGTFKFLHKWLQWPSSK